ALTAAYEATGNDTNINFMFDINCAWSLSQSHDMFQKLAPFSPSWIEEPLWPPEDISGLASLQKYNVPVSAGENTAGLYGFLSLMSAKAIDIAQPSVTKIGGITELLR